MVIRGLLCPSVLMVILNLSFVPGQPSTRLRDVGPFPRRLSELKNNTNVTHACLNFFFGPDYFVSELLTFGRSLTDAGSRVDILGCFDRLSALSNRCRVTGLFFKAVNRSSAPKQDRKFGGDDVFGDGGDKCLFACLVFLSFLMEPTIVSRPELKKLRSVNLNSFLQKRS